MGVPLGWNWSPERLNMVIYKHIFNLLSLFYDPLITLLTFFMRGPGYEKHVRSTILAELDCLPGQRVLEVGVGTGTNLNYIDKSVHITGVDPAGAMLRRCRKRARMLGIDAVLFCQEAESLPFDNEQFDRVLCVNVLMYSRSPDRIIEEALRVLKPGGLFVVAVKQGWFSNNRHLLDTKSEGTAVLKCKQVGSTQITVVRKIDDQEQHQLARWMSINF